MCHTKVKINSSSSSSSSRNSIIQFPSSFLNNETNAEQEINIKNNLNSDDSNRYKNVYDLNREKIYVEDINDFSYLNKIEESNLSIETINMQKMDMHNSLNYFLEDKEKKDFLESNKYLISNNKEINEKLLEEKLTNQNEINAFQLSVESPISCLSVQATSSPSSSGRNSFCISPLFIPSPSPEMFYQVEEEKKKEKDNEYFIINIIHTILLTLIHSKAYNGSRHTQQCRNILANKLCEICYFNETSVLKIVKNIENSDTVLNEFKKYIGIRNTDILLGEIELAFWKTIGKVLIEMQSDLEKIEEKFNLKNILQSKLINQKNNMLSSTAYEYSEAVMVMNNIYIERFVVASEKYADEMICQADLLNVLRSDNMLNSIENSDNKNSFSENEYELICSNAKKIKRKREEEEKEEKEEKKEKEEEKTKQIRRIEDMVFDWCYF